MDAKVACTLRAALHIILTLQQVGGYTYRNQRRFTEDIDWSYAGTLNQNNWAKKYPWCSSAKQSPIDVEENLAQVKLQYQKLRLDGWDNLTGQRTAINNDGKTVALDVDGDFYVSGGGLGSKFKAGRITFHWGRCNASSSEGSEHSLDGVKYPLEMQIYCFEPQRFDSFQQSVKAGGRITALAVLFEASSEEDNANFATIIDAINSVSRYGKSAPVSPFTPRTLLPNSTDKYFIYNGSLTTPPCSETVEWIVFKNTVCISPDQLEVFCEVMTMQQAGYVMLMDYLQNNYREQQRNFMGQVFSSYTGTEELLTPACSSEPEKAEVTAYNASSLLVTWERPRAVYDSAIERYSVSYKMADAQDAAAAEYLTDGDQDVGAILDDLLANASYVVRVVAVCANGLYGRVSDPLTFTVPADGPGNSLIPDSNPFDYEEETSPPDPSLNESVQEEDYDQAWITTKAPASSTWGPHRRPPQQDVAAPETQSTTVAASSSQRTSSSRPPGASTTPLYANARDRQGGVEPKSSENTKADLNLTLTTVSSSWMNGGIGLPLNHTTTTTATSATSKTVTRPVTTTMKTTEPTNKTAMNGDTALAADASRNETTTATRPMSKTTTIKKTMELTPYSTANKTVTTSKTTSNMTKTMATTAYTTTKNTTATNPPTNKTTSMTRPVTNTMNRTTGMTTSPTANKTMTRPMNKTTTMTPPTNKTTSVTSPLANSTNKTTTMKTTMELTTNSTANKTTTRTLPTNKTATMTGPLNKTTTMNPATNKNTTVTRPLTTTTNKTTTMNTTKEMTTNPLTTPTNKNATMNTKIATMTTNKTTTINTTMVSTNTTSNKMVTSNQPMNKTPTETETMNKTLTMTKTKTPTTNLTHLSDHSITPSSVHTDPYEGPTIPETDYENGLPDEAGVPIQDGPRGKSPPRGPTTPSIPHFPTTRTWVWRSGVVLQTTPPFSKDVSDSSHESRVGSIGDGERKALVPLAVISTLTALGLVVLIGILIYWRLCFQTAHFYVDESSSPRVADTSAFASGNLAGNSPAKIKVLQKDISLPVCLPDEKAALPVQDFVRHVAELHRSDGFQRKFQLLKESYEEVQACTSDAAMTSETSNHPDNRSKNRYSNILAFDHSRVRLSTTDKDGCGGDYINANFVDGYKMRDAYIAAQGPLKSSTDDFWRMIWQHNVGVIVMITNLLENGRRKCEQYWPTDTCEDYGGLLVALKSVHELAHYTERTFTVTSTQVKKGSQRRRGQERVVTQYHYTQWPDMGVPDHALPLLGFIRQSSRARTANMGPVVVHCSAGVGRTGAYLVLDSMLRQMRQEDAVDVDGFLRHVRTQRNYLVQTQEQYVFIHDALVEAILCGDTEVAASRLHAYVERLLTPRRDGGATLDRQLQQLLNADATNDDASALHDDNRQKNRSGSLLPAERSRVRLSPCAGETSDYINASYVMGYRHCKEFIVTQNPLPGTVKDFWRMIWEHNVRVIVSLPGPAPAQDEDEEEAEPCVFWPGKGEPISCATLTVAQTCENVICLANEDTLAVHHLTVQAAHDDFVAEVRLYRAPRWPNPDGAISDTFLLLRLLRDQTAAKEGAAVILDRVGGVTAGTFCALSSLIGQLDHRRRVDVFRAARMSNLARPGTFRTRDRLSFLYEALLSVLDEPRDDDDDDHDDDERQSREERRPRRRSSGAAGQERNGAPALPGGRGSPGGLESLV
ncbi:receptor-type tyrosine-protein phosphatase gamma-like isoform X10 [Festucalex cinctus]